MNALGDLLERGGPVMVPIVILAVLLYERCGNLLLFLMAARRRLPPVTAPATGSRRRIRRLLLELPERYEEQRMVIGSMIAGAPLLGLLGTVMGMIATFDSLAQRTGERSMQGLAAGISQALITTETGLAVIIPAILILYFAHRQLQAGVRHLVQLEAALDEAAQG